MQKRRILIVDNNDELRALLERVLGNLGHAVVVTGDRDEALAREDLDQFDLIISDLTEDANSNGQPVSEMQRKHLLVPVACDGSTSQLIKAFKMGAANYLRMPYNQEELRQIVEQTLSYKLKYVDDPTVLPQVHEKIEFELPSDLALMNGVLQYLLERVSKLGLIKPERSNLFIALDEAFLMQSSMEIKTILPSFCASQPNCPAKKPASQSKTKELVSIFRKFPILETRPTCLRPLAGACCLSTTSWTKLSTMRRVIA